MAGEKIETALTIEVIINNDYISTEDIEAYLDDAIQRLLDRLKERGDIEAYATDIATDELRQL